MGDKNARKFYDKYGIEKGEDDLNSNFHPKKASEWVEHSFFSRGRQCSNHWLQNVGNVRKFQNTHNIWKFHS